MPIIKSAIKRMNQNRKRRERRQPLKSLLKSQVKKAFDLIDAGKTEEAKKLVPYVYSVIDTAVKKKILHPNTAARRKSRIARGINGLEAK